MLQQQLSQQQQQPFLSQPYQQPQQPQQQLCSDGSLPDVNGNCPSIHQQLQAQL